MAALGLESSSGDETEDEPRKKQQMDTLSSGDDSDSTKGPPPPKSGDGTVMGGFSSDSDSTKSGAPPARPSAGGFGIGLSSSDDESHSASDLSSIAEKKQLGTNFCVEWESTHEAENGVIGKIALGIEEIEDYEDPPLEPGEEEANEAFTSGFGDMGSDTEDEDGNVKLDEKGEPRKSRYENNIPDNWREGLDPDDERLRGGPFYRDPNFADAVFTDPRPEFEGDKTIEVKGKCHYAFLMGNPCHWIISACDYGLWEEYIGFRGPCNWQKGCHPEVADTLWETYRSPKSDDDKHAVYKKLADMCRLSLGEGTEWGSILKWTRTGNRHHDKMVEGSKLPIPKNVYGKGCKKGTNFSVGVMIGFERGDLLYCDAAVGESHPPFTDADGKSLVTENAGEDNCMNIFWLLDPHYGEHRLYMWVCQQYSARQQWGIWNRIINKPLLREGYVPPPPHPDCDPRAVARDDMTASTENTPVDCVE